MAFSIASLQAFAGRHCSTSFYPQHLNSGQGLAFQPFQEGAAGGRNIGEAVGHACGIERRDRIAAARHRDKLAGFASVPPRPPQPRRCRCRTVPSRRRRTGRSIPASSSAPARTRPARRCAGRYRESCRRAPTLSTSTTREGASRFEFLRDDSIDGQHDLALRSLGLVP